MEDSYFSLIKILTVYRTDIKTQSKTWSLGDDDLVMLIVAPAQGSWDTLIETKLLQQTPKLTWFAQQMCHWVAGTAVTVGEAVYGHQGDPSFICSALL